MRENGRTHRCGARRRGVVLLLVMLVVSILFVILGQFSYSAKIDRALAENHVRNAQAWCDFMSAVAVCKAAVAREGAPSALSFELAQGGIAVAWTSESGKFNLNTLRSEEPGIPTEQCERLFKTLEENGTLTTLGLAKQVIEFVKGAERPLLTLGELLQVEAITPELLKGVEGKEGLSKFLTVYSDGTIDIGQAPAEVVACLDESLSNPRTLELLKEKLKNPQAQVPGYIETLARQLKDSTTSDMPSYLARVTVTSAFAARTFEVALRKSERGAALVLCNEIGETGERIDQ
jgi:type II secretory pathway component PulK